VCNVEVVVGPFVISAISYMVRFLVRSSDILEDYCDLWRSNVMVEGLYIAQHYILKEYE
jgi:hypothetical protein